jgi:hypothetical protein
MPDEHILALREANQARTDFALLESHLETIAGQLARTPTRAFLCSMLLFGDSKYLGSPRCRVAHATNMSRLEAWAQFCGTPAPMASAAQ